MSRLKHLTFGSRALAASLFWRSFSLALSLNCSAAQAQCEAVLVL